MKFYLAPMEGITIFIYRNAYARFFGDMDKYFTPFIMPNKKRIFRTRELQDVLLEHNEGIHLVPQILSRKSEEFIKTAKELQKMGYDEVNLNLGCPSKTVVSKGKGSGFLKDLEELECFLDEIFEGLDMKISVKTRIGMSDPEEFEEIMDVYNRYPIHELIIHPRVQEEFYRGTVHMDAFRTGWEKSKNPVCYNGDIVREEDYQRLVNDFPKLEAVMIGRGILRNPALAGQIRSGKKLEKKDLRAMHDQIYGDYQEYLSGQKNILFKMKDFWTNPIQIFTDYEKYAKKIRKTQTLKDYEKIIDSLFLEQDIAEELC